MKKQIKPLTLNKMTISNLSASDMSRMVGGGGKTTTTATPPTPDSIFCWSQKCQRFTKRVTCTSL